MSIILDHIVVSSLKEFLVYNLLNELDAYSNKTAVLTPYVGARKFAGKETYQTPYCQWCYDSSINNIQIPSGVGSLSRGQSGISFDFKNGRVIADSGTNLSGSINVSVPEFNFYATTSSISNILLEEKYTYKPYNSSTLPKPDSIVAPCIILSCLSSKNSEIYIDGLIKSLFQIQVAVLADNPYHLFGVQKMIRDIAGKVFPILSLTPFNELNDLKADYWNYSWVQDWLSNQSNLLYVEDSSFKISDIASVNINHPNLLVGIGEINLCKHGSSDGLVEDNYQIPYSLNNSSLYSNADGVYILE